MTPADCNRVLAALDGRTRAEAAAHLRMSERTLYRILAAMAATDPPWPVPAGRRGRPYSVGAVPPPPREVQP